MSDGADTPPQNVPLNVPTEQVARQAAASLAGHLFQATRAASEWVKLGPDAKLLVEVAEDYAVLVRNALGMTQTKQEFSGPVTLRSDGVRKSLAGLIAFQDSNPALAVSLAYLTTAEPGKEAKSDLPGGVTGIDYWRAVARGADIAPLRQLLLETQKDEKLLAYIRDADDDTLRSTLIQRVSWLTGSPALPEAKAALEARLRALGTDRTGYADDGERALPFIIYRILETAVADHRVLTRDDFEQVWARATSISVSVSMMRQLAISGGLGGGVPLSAEPPPPPLSSRTAPRDTLVDDLRAELRNADVLWLHGSSGLGKSQLTRLMTARDNSKWEFVSLKGRDAPEQEARVRTAIGNIAREDFAGLILDDLPVPAPEGLRAWIAAGSLEIAANPAARIIVTSEREPLPQVRKAFEPLRIKIRKAPYLEQEDVEHIVAAAGGNADIWAALIRLSSGGGHPLLVDARVAGLASKGWPEGEQLNGFGVGDGPDEIAEVRREVSLRLLGELSPDAHQLLLRISGLIGNFDRRLVDAVAAVEPAIARAGPLFDYLTGPWIEPKRADRFGLSPLLTAASTSLSEAERDRVHNAAVDDLINRNPFPGDMLSALLLYSMIIRHVGGFTFVGQAVINTSQRAELASELFPLLYMKSGDDGRLVPEHAGVSAILRTAQVFAAVNSDPPSMVEKIVGEALAEAAMLPGKLRGANIFTNLMAVLANEGADLAPKVWMPMLAKFREHFTSGQFPAEMIDHMGAVDLGGFSVDQMFFMIRSSKVDTVADVEELFGELDRVDPEWRHSLLTNSSVIIPGPPLFVQKGWSSETGPGTLDAEAADAAYLRMAERAIAWGEDDIAIECVRSRVVMLDEYLGRHDDALALLDEAEQRFGRNERLIRGRATVLATMGRHAEELELLSSLGPGYSEDEPLERLLMLRAAAISAAKLQQFAKAAELFHESYSVAADETPGTLGASVLPGLKVDAALMEIRDGRFSDALASLAKALELVSAGQSDDVSSLFAYAAITHVTQWAAAKIESQPFPQDPSTEPGICSTLTPKFDPAQLEVRKPNQELYLLARLETLVGHDVSIAAELNARERVDGVHLKLAIGVSAMQLEHHIEHGDAEAFFSLLPRHAWLSSLYVRTGGVDGVHLLADDMSSAAWDEPGLLSARAAVSRLLGAYLLDERLVEAERAAVRAGELSPGLGNLLPEAGEESVETPDLFSAGLASLGLLQHETVLNAEQMLHTSVQLFLWLRHIGAEDLNRRTHRMLAEKWLDLAQHRRAILSNPGISVPAIEAAAASDPGIAGIARLIEAGRLASSVGLPDHIAEMLSATR